MQVTQVRVKFLDDKDKDRHIMRNVKGPVRESECLNVQEKNTTNA